MSSVQVQLVNTGGQATFEGFISPSPLYLLGPYTITATTAGLTTGVPLVILPAGAIIYDIGCVTLQQWDGTTPKMDVGSFHSGNTGLFDQLAGGVVALDHSYDSTADNDDLVGAAGGNVPISWLQAAVGSAGADGGAAYFASPLYVLAIDSTAGIIHAVVSQDGAKGGTATGAANGSTNVYLVVGTPLPS
jgi:hypothetical protein